jgi:hypothetical protein
MMIGRRRSVAAETAVTLARMSLKHQHLPVMAYHVLIMMAWRLQRGSQ